MRLNSSAKGIPWLAWIPLVLLISVSLTAAVVPNLKPVFKQLHRSRRVVSLRNPDQARFVLSPWLRTFFHSADKAQRYLENDVSVIIGGETPWFVAYRLSPRKSFFERPGIELRLRRKGLIYSRIGDTDPPTTEAHEIVVFSDGFEQGRSSVWSHGPEEPQLETQ